jgi:hypothetical protein
MIEVEIEVSASSKAEAAPSLILSDGTKLAPDFDGLGFVFTVPESASISRLVLPMKAPSELKLVW